MKKTTRLTVQSPPSGGGGDTAQETIVVGLYLRVSTDRQANEGYPPYGYTCVNNEWAIFPKEKEIVEIIFSRFRTFRSTLDVAKHLNDAHISARRGRIWDCRMILKILQNPSYLGHRKWKKQLFQNTQAPIISEKQFEETQAPLKLQRYFERRFWL